MRAAGLQGRSPRRFKRTTIPDPAAAERADLIRRDFAVDAAAVNRRWCGDITYIGTWEGWLYLATVIDIASRRVVGYALAFAPAVNGESGRGFAAVRVSGHGCGSRRSGVVVSGSGAVGRQADQAPWSAGF